MTARELLEFVIEYNLDGEDLNEVEIRDDAFLPQSDFIKFYFGCTPEKEIPNGYYLYVWSDKLPVDFYVQNSADLILQTDGNYKIYLFRIDD